MVSASYKNGKIVRWSRSLRTAGQVAYRIPNIVISGSEAGVSLLGTLAEIGYPDIEWR